MKAVLFFILFITLHAEILEIGRFDEAVPHIGKDTLVVLDIDDTLLIPRQMLGCDEWFIYRINKREKEGMAPRESLEKSLAEWEAVRHITEMEIVEPGTEAIVQALQKKGHAVMGLTTQGLALATRTSQQLKANRFDLTLTAPYKEDFYFSLNRHGILYRNGILFTSGMPKGEALFKLCDMAGCCPKQIVFINDKESHLADVEATAKKRGVPFIGLRYAYSDARKEAFSAEIAEYQFSHSSFAKLMTDQEAKSSLKNWRSLKRA